jgi:hypothetical protein
MLTGPFFFPAAYKMYCLCVFAFLFFKGVQTIIWNFCATYKAYRLLSKAQKAKDRKAAGKDGQ